MRLLRWTSVVTKKVRKGNIFICEQLGIALMEYKRERII